jgi:hypothetical protein
MKVYMILSQAIFSAREGVSFMYMGNISRGHAGYSGVDVRIGTREARAKAYIYQYPTYICTL